ncbi:adenosine kinase [Hamiltosporidium magnivora]|uniref:Adenosine kinase n=1 Tax=Hamiltosporidium magnivora TaxID=148818 RepID=A0A4Q9LL37_9MICR|nr:adenosine kinase [Hamiltosporidium magnivora]
MLDIRIKCEKSLLENLDLEENGYVQINGKNNYLLEKLQDLKAVRLSSGGTSLNTFIFLSKKGNIPLYFIGSVGNDKYLKILENELDILNIKYSFEIFDNNRTAKCFVLLNGRQRSLVTDLGASTCLSLKYVDTCLCNLPKNVFFYMSGFMIAAHLELSFHILDILKKNQLILNLSSYTLFSGSEYFFIKKYFDISNVVVGNFEEFYSFYKRVFGKEPINIRQILVELGYKNQTLICTDGGKDIYYTKNGKVYSSKIDKYLGDNVDTCGAGDAFAAGILYGFYKKYSIEEIIQIGKDWSEEYILENTKMIQELIF